MATQELVQLVLELKRGVRPDVVVFYDGLNEVFAAAQSGLPMVHQELPRIEARFNQAGESVGWLHNLAVFQLAAELRRSPNVDAQSALDPTEVSELADLVVANYIELQDAGARLADAYDFDIHFFWQPYLLVDDKPLSPEELEIRETTRSRLPPSMSLEQLFRETYALAAEKTLELDRWHDLSDVFQTHRQPIWIDGQGHVTPEGNRLVADRMLERFSR